jgi:hypothetical protein
MKEGMEKGQSLVMVKTENWDGLKKGKDGFKMEARRRRRAALLEIYKNKNNSKGVRKRIKNKV